MGDRIRVGGRGVRPRPSPTQTNTMAPAAPSSSTTPYANPRRSRMARYPSQGWRGRPNDGLALTLVRCCARHSAQHKSPGEHLRRSSDTPSLTPPTRRHGNSPQVLAVASVPKSSSTSLFDARTTNHPHEHDNGASTLLAILSSRLLLSSSPLLTLLGLP